jgi:hypothetical protein
LWLQDQSVKLFWSGTLALLDRTNLGGHQAKLNPSGIEVNPRDLHGQSIVKPEPPAGALAAQLVNHLIVLKILCAKL